MEKCFIIQPFDKGKYDKRYTDIFEPAIIEAGLEPYRIDSDPSVRIPINEIEKMILDSKICFAEITTNNPNVWYELGYAYACRKDVVLVCSNERENNYPFDIQHRAIIEYKTESSSDYENLKQSITKKLIAFIKKINTINSLTESPILPYEGLTNNEMSILAIIFENQSIDYETISTFTVENEMEKIGFTKFATRMAIKTLENKYMIERSIEYDWNNNEFVVFKLKEIGLNWLIQNKEKFQFYKNPNFISDDDVPF